MKLFLIGLLGMMMCAAVSGQTVFKTPSGARYHLSNCSTVKNVSREISAEEARSIGLTPCLRCKPANIYGSSVPVVHKAQGVGMGVQCNGITKAGSRCRHKTRIGNGYCFQHQP